MVGPGTLCSQDNACHISLNYQYHENICQVLDH